MKLRTLRTQKHLTLSRLAVETWLSTALLSNRPNDSNAADSFELLPGLRGRIELFYRRHETHAGDHPEAHLLGNGRVRESPLHAVDSKTCLVARMIDFPAGQTTTITDAGSTLCSVVSVLDSKLQLDAGDLHETLETGDCAYIESDIAISWSAGGGNQCRALVVTPGSHRQD